MKRKKFLPLFFLIQFLVFTPMCFAQKQGQARIDSLLGVLPSMPDDTNQVTRLVSLSFTYWSINPNEGIKRGAQALALAEKLNYKKGIAYSEIALGINYSFGKCDYPKALEYYFKSLKISEARGDMTAVSATLNNIGGVYDSQSDYPKALEYYLKGLKLSEKLSNSHGKASTIANIGVLYYNLGKYDSALLYEFDAQKMYEEQGDESGKSRNLGHIGLIYNGQKKFPEALDYFFKSLAMTESLGDKNGTGLTLKNIGTSYLLLASDTGIEAVSGLKKLFSGNKTAALQKAKIYTDSSIILFKEIDELNFLFQSYQQLSEIQNLLHDDEGALASYKNYTVFKDSVFNMEKNKKLTETAMQYEFDKKEAATKAEQDKKFILQRNIRNIMIGAAAFFLLLLIGLFGRYRYKQRTNKKLQEAYDKLKATQEQLLQHEKMAALGVMARRMAHEIQNPLNFVNNFSDMSGSLIDEIVTSENQQEKVEAADKLKQNLERINHHGKRASDIISQLQEHTRSGTASDFFDEV